MIGGAGGNGRDPGLSPSLAGGSVAGQMGGPFGMGASTLWPRRSVPGLNTIGTPEPARRCGEHRTGLAQSTQGRARWVTDQRISPPAIVSKIGVA